MTPETINDSDTDQIQDDESGLTDNISGLGQKIIGKIETIGGVLTGDPITQAEGEYNVEVGEVREEIEKDLGETTENEKTT